MSARSVPARLGILPACAAGCLWWLADSASVLDWLIGMAAVTTTVCGVRLPLATSLATTVLLVCGFEFGTTGPVVAKVAAGIAMTELAARHAGWRSWLGAAALAAAYLLHPAGGAAALGYRAVVMASLPLLIGGLLRSAREGAVSARRAADELARHRTAEVAAARASERTAIARELHDLIAHHISSTVLRVGVARHAYPSTPPAVREVLDDIHASGRETLSDLRKMVMALRDPSGRDEPFVAPADLPAAVTDAVARIRRHGIPVHTEIDDLTTVDPLSALTLLRLTQEGLANVIKHGGSGTRARLEVAVSDGVDFLLVNTGSVSALPKGPPGIGLVGLAERIELLGGTFTAGPTSTGWRLAAHLPGRGS